MEIHQHIRPAFFLFIVVTLLTGIIYPLAVTGLAQLLFPWQASGSLIEHEGRKLGSVLIGQAFTDPKYFWGRPSATTPFPYNATASSGSNLGPFNPDFLTLVKGRIAHLNHNMSNTQLIPIDLVTASSSGLDPDISPASAYFQVPRIALARGLSEAALNLLVAEMIKPQTYQILGAPCVNVLQLNLALDKLIISNKKQL